MDVVEESTIVLVYSGGRGWVYMWAAIGMADVLRTHAIDSGWSRRTSMMHECLGVY